MHSRLSGVVLASVFILGSTFKVPTISLEDLLHPTWGTVSQIEEAVSQVGLFAVTLGDEQQKQKAAALKELVSCVRSGRAEKHVNVVEMEDETVRSTLATSTNQSVAEQFDAELKSHCPSFVKLAESVRDTTATVGAAYAKVLDKVEHKDLSSTKGPFGAAVARSENLEHFHVYWRRDERKDDTPTLKMHTDLGMFIVLTPPMYFHFAGSVPASHHIDSGFQVKLPNGDVVTPEFPAGSVVVMNGEGLHDWVQSTAASGLYVPPHQVVLPGGTKGIGRAWYGRMYLPPRNSLKQDEQEPVTFNQYWTGAADSLIQAQGQAALGHRTLLDPGNCSAGQLYCWMQCMNASSVSTCPSSNIQCKDPSTGTVWFPGMTHCMGCSLMCNATTPNTTNTTNTTSPSPSPSPSPYTPNPSPSPSAGVAFAPELPLLASLLLALVAMLHL